MNMKVIDITSRLIFTSIVKIACMARRTDGQVVSNTIWEGEPQNMPADLLDRNLYAIEPTAEDVITIHI